MIDTVVIAGKNNIAVDVEEHLRKNHPDITLLALFNLTDNGTNTFQKSFKKYCEINGIQSIELEQAYALENSIFLSLEYDRLIKPAKFSTKALYNIHFSYLPAYKGMYTSAWPIINNEKYSGVTLHRIDAGIDTGDIIDQVKFEIGAETTGQELYLKNIEYGTSLVINNLQKLLTGKFDTEPQSAFGASYYSKASLNYANLEINFEKTAFEIYNQIRAFSFPAYQLPKFNDQKIYHSEITSQKSKGKSGQIIFEDEFSITITTIDYHLRLLLDKRDELFEACKNGDISYIRHLAKHNYPLNQRSKEGWDALIVAAYNGHFDLVKLLIEEFSWNHFTMNNNGTTFLMYVMTNASKSGDTRILEYVLKKFPDIDLKQKDYYGYDIYYYAEKLNNRAVLQLL